MLCTGSTIITIIWFHWPHNTLGLLRPCVGYLASICTFGGSTRAGFNVKTDEQLRAGSTELKGRIWPLGWTLSTPVDYAMYYYFVT